MTWIFWTIIACIIWTLTRIVVYSTIYPQKRRPVMAQGGNNNLCEIEGEIKGETERAWRFYDGKTVEWIPKSLCEWHEESKTMIIPEWICLEKGFL